MNNKGFTLVELLATLVILSIVIGITIGFFSDGFGNTKEKTEEVFVETLKDALNIYLDSDAKSLDFSVECSSLLNKSHGSVRVYKVGTTFEDVINSKYRPINLGDLVNPANEEVECANPSEIVVNIYRDEDFVYYYSVLKSEFNNSNGDVFFLNDSDGVISNLPEGYVCE